MKLSLDQCPDLSHESPADRVFGSAAVCREKDLLRRVSLSRPNSGHSDPSFQRKARRPGYELGPATLFLPTLLLCVLRLTSRFTGQL